MNTNKIVIGVAGMPGSGKSVIVEAARQNGYSVIVMGDIIREETQKKGLALNPENIGKVMLELREKSGSTTIAEKCIPKIEQNTNERVIVDGIRSLAEADTFARHFPKFTLVAVHASPQTRFKRLNIRGRSDDTDKWETFHERDVRELSVGIGNAIAMAEYMLINDGHKGAVDARAAKLLQEVENKWKK